MRLAIATRLGIEEGDEEFWYSLPDDDPRAQVHDIYDWVGYLQETLVRARRLIPLRGVPRARASRATSGRLGRVLACPASPRLVHVLRLDRAMYDAIVAHAKRDHPDEACGIVAGAEGSDVPSRHVPMVNAAGSPTFYEFDSTELLALYKQMWDSDEEPVVIYHSHTATEAYPSRTDIGLANEPGAHYVLVSHPGARE